MSVLLRRLYTDDRYAVQQEAANPFEGVRKARTGRRLRVGLHTSASRIGDEQRRRLVRTLFVPAAHGAIELIFRDKDVPSWYPPGTAFRLEPTPRGHHEAVLQITDDVGQQVVGESRTAVHRREVWRWQAAQLGIGESIDELLELEALGALGTDVVVVADQRLLGRREAPSLRPLNLMTPEESHVLVGVWSRTIHEAYIPPYGCNNGLYYWAVARALTPAAWPGYFAIVRAGRRLPDGEELIELGGSMLDQLKMLVRGLDRLIAVWQCKANNDTLVQPCGSS